ncbi:hypothetical protein M758_UG277100 [Ceratodon purpureus]|nr:hypothetical protein M758_UG277100 [Ceratodon purpureus]
MERLQNQLCIVRLWQATYSCTWIWGKCRAFCTFNSLSCGESLSLQPMSMVLPGVVGFKLNGKLRTGVTATDLVLTVTQMLRKMAVVGKFVEFYGKGMSELTVADRATIANMSPEYGATMGFFPVDRVTLDYLRMTGRDEKKVMTFLSMSEIERHDKA